MLKKAYFESIHFSQSKKFKVSRKMDENYRGKLHWHPFMEILVCLADQLQVTVNFSTYTVTCNDIVLVYPGDLHSLQDCRENDLLIIQFPYELLTVLNEFRVQETQFFQFPVIRYDPRRPEQDRMVLLLKDLARTAGEEHPCQEMQMYALLLNFFAQAGSYCSQCRQTQGINSPNPRCKVTKQMAEACLFIAHNCTNPLTLEEVAGHMGMSKSHFAHLFKEFTGMTFLDFLLGERIRRAKALFGNDNARIIDIAFDSGFASISSFNRAFRKYTGLTPSEYRDGLKAAEE